jgi:hypothetical protein
MRVQTVLKRALWAGLLVALLVLPNLFALQQLPSTGGYLFYANAFDEPTYLSYDGAMLTRSFTHWAEYLVVALHKLGISGGYVNLAFDVLFPVVTVVLLRRIATMLGFSALESIVYPFVVVAIPVIFGYSNPYYSRLYDLNFNSKGLSWITLPQAYYPPFFRTPEPQLSLAVVALASYAAIRWHSFLPGLAVVPVLYPFVGIPYMFIVVGMMIEQRLGPWMRHAAWRTATALLVSYLTIAGTIGVFYLLFVRRTSLADFLPPTHLPLMSGTGAVAMVVYLLARSRLETKYRLPALFVAVAPIAAANTQLMTGFLQAPHSLEQNFGVVAVAIVCVLAIAALGPGPWLMLGAAAASCCLLAMYSSQIFFVNASILQRTSVSKELLDALRVEPESVVIADPDLADMFSLVAPRIHFSALARSQTVRSSSGVESTTSDRFQNYLCVKQLLSGNAPEWLGSAAFGILDQGYRYLNQDFPLIHLNRTHRFKPIFDPSEDPPRCGSRRLQVFPSYVLGNEFSETKLPPSITTPQQQWAHASIVELAAATTSERAERRLVDVTATVTVTHGCISVGVLTPDQRTLLSRIAIASTGAPRAIDLLVESADKPNWLVLGNCSASGASAGTIHDVRTFSVEKVTTKSLAAAVPATARP